jgi:hypothetical protein
VDVGWGVVWEDEVLVGWVCMDRRLWRGWWEIHKVG